MKIKQLIQFLIVGIITVFISCSEKIDNLGTCSDGIKNQNELGIDCGGPCADFCPNCGDGIMNQGETGVDCGGPCDPCYPRLSSDIDGILWNSTSRNAMLSGPSAIRIYGTNQVNSITLHYGGPFVASTYSTSQGFSAEFRDGNGNLYESGTSGTITFTAFDTTLHEVTGTFSFTAIDNISGNQVTISDGVFNVLQY